MLKPSHGGRDNVGYPRTHSIHSVRHIWQCKTLQVRIQIETDKQVCVWSVIAEFAKKMELSLLMIRVLRKFLLQLVILGCKDVVAVVWVIDFQVDRDAFEMVTGPEPQSKLGWSEGHHLILGWKSS